MKEKIKYLIVGIVIVIADQLSKIWIVNNVKDKPNIVLIEKIFELEYLENRGAAFSSFNGQQLFLVGLTVVILGFALFEFIRIPADKRYGWLHLAFSFLISGAVGNLIDRIKQGYVVDFFYFVPINFPRFNVADIFITISVPILMILLFFVYSDSETEFLFKFKNR